MPFDVEAPIGATEAPGDTPADKRHSQPAAQRDHHPNAVLNMVFAGGRSASFGQQQVASCPDRDLSRLGEALQEPW